MVLVPDCLSSVPHSQGWDLAQVRCAACFHALIEGIWHNHMTLQLDFWGREVRDAFLAFLQGYQNSQHFSDQD